MFYYFPIDTLKIFLFPMFLIVRWAIPVSFFLLPFSLLVYVSLLFRRFTSVTLFLTVICVWWITATMSSSINCLMSMVGFRTQRFVTTVFLFILLSVTTPFFFAARRVFPMSLFLSTFISIWVFFIVTALILSFVCEFFSAGIRLLTWCRFFSWFFCSCWIRTAFWIVDRFFLLIFFIGLWV